MLIFSDRMRTGAFMAVWSVALVRVKKLLHVIIIITCHVNIMKYFKQYMWKYIFEMC